MTPRRRLTARVQRAHTRIAVRLLLFNLLLVFLPVAGLLYLDTYERHLLEQQERAMIDAGRILSASLAGQPLEPPRVRALAARLARRIDARLRVVDHDGRILADTHAMDAITSVTPAAPAVAADPARSSWLYRTGAALAGAIRPLYRPLSPVFDAESIVVAPGRIAAPEVTRALAGDYGAATRLSPGGQRSMTLYSALPIGQGEAVAGAVLVSQSTWRILQRLYDVRLRMVTVVAASVVFAVVLMAVASFTIVTPIRRLRDDAESLADRRGRLVGRFRGADRRDEIGELARALDDLTRRLETQLRFSEGFAADVTHEFRNPLASIRAAAETFAEAEAPADRAAFRRRIEQDIRRLESLLSGVRDLTLVDTRLEEETRQQVDLRDVLRDVVDGRSLCTLQVPDAPLVVRASADRLLQVLENLVDNAESFTPDGRGVDVAASRQGAVAVVSVRDHGPGIPPEHLTRVFDRFFCHRPDQPDSRQRHAGLGLAIALAIAHSYGGTIEAANHPGGGAVFELRIPRVP